MMPDPEEKRRLRLFENAVMIFFAAIVAAAVIGILLSLFRPGSRPTSPAINLRG